MERSTWCDNPDGKSWNVKKAESEIGKIKRFALFYRRPEMTNFGEKQVIDLMFRDKATNEAVKAAAKEMASILMGNDNPTGCHLNHAVSGKTVYSVFDNDVSSYKHLGSYDTREDAEAARAELDDATAALARVEAYGDSFVLMVLDEEETDRLRESECYGTFVADFDSMEEAEVELENLEEGYIVEMPADQWWMVVDNERKASLFKKMFPSETRALAFLYKYRTPPAWKRLLELMAVRERVPAEEEGVVGR